MIYLGDYNSISAFKWKQFTHLTYISNCDTILGNDISAIPDAIVGVNENIYYMSCHFSLKFCDPITVSTLRVIHYGSSCINTEHYLPIRNLPKDHERGGIKPAGGLWTCPESSNFSWKNYCLENNQDDYLKNSFILRLNQDAKVIVIDEYEDLRLLPKRKDNPYLVDWELLAKFGDAIWLTEKGCLETILSEPYHLCGWDCESVLLMNLNPKAIQEI